MVYSADQLSDKIKPLITYRPFDMSVYMVGSRSRSRRLLYKPELSDTDLLIVPICDSLGDYVSHFEQAIKIYHSVEQEDEVVDVFFMSSKLAYDYFMILPVISGCRAPEAEDLIYGNGKHLQKVEMPKNDTRREIYRAKAYTFVRQCEDVLPVADTSMARKISKRIFQGMKIIVCALSTDELTELEERLININEYDLLCNEYNRATNSNIVMPQILKDVLEGEDVDDWSAWMVGQEYVLRNLMKLGAIGEYDVNRRLLYDGVASVRDLLNRHLKDVISCDDQLREGRTGTFADEAAKTIVRLAGSGVDQLKDLDAESCPAIVREAYEVMITHLQGEECGLRCLSAAVVLLEYAFEQCVKVLNRQV